MPTKEQCIEVARDIFTEALVDMLTTDPVVAARRAYRDGGLPLEVIEARIRAMQAEMSVPAKKAA